jgi:hypothetical protein
VRCVLALALALAACRADRPSPAPTAPVAAPGAAAPAAAPSVDAAVRVAADPKADPEAPLEAEARESNPTSEKVTIKLSAWPVEANVFWGNKDLGVAGRKPLEIERPRGSGPVDLVARAPGYLPFHTRLFTDRDEKLTVRLVRTEDAPQLLGYRRMTAGAAGAPGAP